MSSLQAYLIVSALLFAIGFAGALARRNAILVLIGIELMLNAANLNFIAFWHYGSRPDHHVDDLNGMMFVIFSIAIAAAEAAVGLALIIAIYRHYKTTNLDQVDSMKG
jgi:NADH-quinone oxidoreductase subunit K